jgi:hypothetical protein
VSTVVWLRELPNPGAAGFRIGRDGGELVAEWEGVATLRASRDAEWHDLVVAEGITAMDADKLRAGPVRGLLRHLRGDMTVHGSAVSINGHAVAFVGLSGAGKSTIAADACHRLGATLLADDLVTIDRRDDVYAVAPTDSVHWLLPDSRDALGLSRAGVAKLPVDTPRGGATIESANARLCAIVSLCFDDTSPTPRLSPIGGVESFEAINAGFVRFVVDEPQVALRDLDEISRLAASVPVFRLTRRRAFEDLASAARLLLTTLEDWWPTPADHERKRPDNG